MARLNARPLLRILRPRHLHIHVHRGLADALPRRGLTLAAPAHPAPAALAHPCASRVQADAVPPLRPVWKESKATAASLIVHFPHPRIAAQVRAPLRVCGGGSRGYRRARDITRCWSQASCLSQARRAASMPRKPPRPSNPRYVNARQHVRVLLLRAAPAAQCLASCTRCARLRAIHGLPCTALRWWLHACARAPTRRRPPELAHGLDASMRCLSSPSMARRLRAVNRSCARVVGRGFGWSAAARWIASPSWVRTLSERSESRRSNSQSAHVRTSLFNCSLLSS